MRSVALILVITACSGDFELPEVASDLIPGAELCDFGDLPPMELRFEEQNCGPLEGRDESTLGSGVGFCSAAIPLDGILPDLVAHVTCDVEAPECVGVADTPDGCMWGVRWGLPENRP